MESSIASAAQGFNLKCTRIYRDKFGYICATDKGLVRIQRPDRGQMVHAQNNQASSGSSSSSSFDNSLLAHILFQHEVKEYLHDKGLRVDRFIISVQAQPYLKMGDDCFVASYAQTPGFNNADFTDDKVFLAIVACVAQMHSHLSAAEFKAKPKTKRRIAADAAKQAENLETLKRKLLRGGKFSEFDMHFLKGCERFIRHIEAYADIPAGKLNFPKYVCHNLLKEENIYHDGNEAWITNFSEAGYANYLFDLAYIIKRRIKARPPQALPLGSILDAYLAHHHHGGDGFDKEIFRRILLYPDKFVKVSMDYYSKKRSFAPKTYLTRIEECFRTDDAMMEYVAT